jgi:hypothetical protein
MSNAYLYRMPVGIAGDITRKEQSTVEAQVMSSTTPVTVFGVPVKMTSGKILPLSSGEDTIYGFLVRPYPTSYTANEALGTSTPSATLACDVLRRGYMTVKNTAGTPAKNGQVYFVSATGLISASASSATAITGCYFMGDADSDGNCEIAYNL